VTSSWSFIRQAYR